MATPPDEIVTTVPTIQKSTTSSSLGGPGHFEFVGERRGILQILQAARGAIYQGSAAIWLPTCRTRRGVILKAGLSSRARGHRSRTIHLRSASTTGSRPRR